MVSIASRNKKLENLNYQINKAIVKIITKHVPRTKCWRRSTTQPLPLC